MIFRPYAGRRSIMEAQADLVQARWESNLDQYDRTEMNSQQPNFTCRVELPSYFYIPNELYYSFGPQLVKQINTSRRYGSYQCRHFTNYQQLNKCTHQRNIFQENCIKICQIERPCNWRL